MEHDADALINHLFYTRADPEGRKRRACAWLACSFRFPDIRVEKVSVNVVHAHPT